MACWRSRMMHRCGRWRCVAACRLCRRSDTNAAPRCPPPAPRSFWGDALVWGTGNRVNSAEECCAACRAYKPSPDKDNLDCNGAGACGH